MANKAQISRDEFHTNAKTIRAEVAGEKVKLAVHDFSSGSFGWKKQKTIFVEVNGKIVPAFLQVNLTIVGSKLEEKSDKEAA